MSQRMPDPLPWHADNWTLLQARRAQDRLPHALLLEGPAGLGKLRFAQRLTAALVCAAPDQAGDACGSCRACRLRASGGHPDILAVTPEEPGKAIRINEIRDLSERSVLSAEGSGYRVCLLHPADAMTHGAANALLKTLEEPVARTVLLLVSAAPSRLPATIRSRCQRLRFEPPSQEQALAWLAGQAGGAAAQGLLGLAGGAPLQALMLVEQGVGARLLALCSDLAALLGGRADPVTLAAQCQDLPLPTLLDYLMQWLIDLVRLKTAANPPMIFHSGREADLQSLAQRIDLRSMFLFFDNLLSLRRQLGNNLNAQLATERLFIDCGQLGG